MACGIFTTLSWPSRATTRAFAAKGVRSLRRLFVRAGANERDPENLDPDVLFPLADMVSVRRDRRLIERNYPNTTFPDGTAVAFPTPSLSTERYDLDEAYPGLVREITATIAALTMARYRPSAYGRDGEELSRESSLERAAAIGNPQAIRVVLAAPAC